MNTKEAVIVVDYQNDFGNKNGSLYVSWGELLAPRINEIMKETKARWWIIITSQDWHPKNHISFASRFQVPEYSLLEWERKWPDHCVAATWGADFIKWFESNLVDRKVLKWFNENSDSYSSFGWIETATGMTLDEILQSYQIEILNIVWLATEYCDFFTVKDALNKWYAVNVFTQGIAPVNQVDWEQAIREMQKMGAKILP